MKVYTYSDARQQLSSVLEQAQKDGKVFIKRRDGSIFSLTPESQKYESSPLDIQGITTEISKEEILSTLATARAIHE